MSDRRRPTSSPIEGTGDTAFVIAPGLLMSALILVGFVSEFFFNGSPVVAIAGIGIVTAGYFVLISSCGFLVEGAFGAMLVTATFGADIPLVSRAYLQTMPRGVGPQLFLFELFLGSLVIAFIMRQQELRVPISSPVWLFAGLIGWCFVATIAARPDRIDTAMFFNLWLVIGFIVFLVSSITVWNTRLRLRTILKILGIAVAGHTFVAFFQLANQQPFGVTIMGENALRTTSTLLIAGHEIEMGIFLQGFTGFGYNLAALHVLLLPVVIALAATTGWLRRKIALYTIATVQLLFLVLTWNHAGIGAAVLAISTVYILVEISRTPSRVSNFKNATMIALSTVGGSFIFVILESPLNAISSAFFSTLSVRVTQYIAAITIARQQPLFGIGPANFYYIATEYGLPRKMLIDNVYLEFLATTGIIGMALFLLFITSIIKTAGFCSVQKKHPYLLGITAGQVGILGLAFWEVLPLMQPTIFIPLMILLGVIAQDPRKAIKNRSDCTE